MLKQLVAVLHGLLIISHSPATIPALSGIQTAPTKRHRLTNAKNNFKKLLSGRFFILFIILSLFRMIFYRQGVFSCFSAASTTCFISTVVVTAPTPPGTGVMASTTAATSSYTASPDIPPFPFGVIFSGS